MGETHSKMRQTDSLPQKEIRIDAKSPANLMDKDWKQLLGIPVVKCEAAAEKNTMIPDESTYEDNPLVKQIGEKEKELASLPNPGLYENCHDEVKRVITLDNFDGFRCDVSRGLTERFAVTHSLWMGTQLIPGGTHYQFGVNNVLGDLAQPPTLLIGRLSHDGRVDARWHQTYNSRLSHRVQAQLSPEPHQHHAMVDFDYKGDDYAANLKLSNGMLVGVSYFQSVTKNLALGGEGYYHGGKKQSTMSYAARYSVPGHVSCLTYSQGVVQAHYLRKLSERWNLGGELVLQLPGGESAVNLAVQCAMRQSRFAAKVDQSGKVSSTLEAKLTPQVSLLMSAEISHYTNEYRFGYGVQLNS